LTQSVTIRLMELIKQLDVIAFDADDTLWRNEELFWEFKAEFIKILAKYPMIDQKKLGQFLDQKEIANIDYYGYGFKSYTLSMIEAFIELTDGKVEGSDIAVMLHLLKQKIHTELDIFIGVKETLMQLYGVVDLMLITKGDTQEQHYKIDKSGLGRYFRWIEIVHTKDENVYHEIFQKYELKPERFMMIGNSLRSDVLPVCALGGKGVHIPNDTNWAHENEFPEEWNKLNYEELDSFLDLIPFLY